jgi:hypothetical protein
MFEVGYSKIYVTRRGHCAVDRAIITLCHSHCFWSVNTIPMWSDSAYPMLYWYCQKTIEYFTSSPRHLARWCLPLVKVNGKCHLGLTLVGGYIHLGVFYDRHMLNEGHGSDPNETYRIVTEREFSGRRYSAIKAGLLTTAHTSALPLSLALWSFYLGALCMKTALSHSSWHEGVSRPSAFNTLYKTLGLKAVGEGASCRLQGRK